jgi:hypothetical protein
MSLFRIDAYPLAGLNSAEEPLPHAHNVQVTADASTVSAGVAAGATAPTAPPLRPAVTVESTTRSASRADRGGSTTYPIATLWDPARPVTKHRDTTTSAAVTFAAPAEIATAPMITASVLVDVASSTFVETVTSVADTYHVRPMFATPTPTRQYEQTVPTVMETTAPVTLTETDAEGTAPCAVPPTPMPPTKKLSLAVETFVTATVTSVAFTMKFPALAFDALQMPMPPIDPEEAVGVPLTLTSTARAITRISAVTASDGDAASNG